MAQDMEFLASIDDLTTLLVKSDIVHHSNAAGDAVLVPSKVAGQSCNLEIAWPRGSRLVHMQQRLPLTVTEERYLDIAVALLQINSSFMIPGFVVDETGMICFRLAVICDENGLVVASQVKNGIATCIQAAESVYSELHAVIAGEANTGDAAQPPATGAVTGPWWADDGNPVASSAVETDMGLLQKILANPHDMELRRAYADELIARGNPRGQFIRLQLEAGSESRQRAEEILRQHHDEWVGPIAKLVTKARFLRGFVEQVTMDARVFVERAPELFAFAPIRSLFLTGAKGMTAELFACPHLGRMVALSLRGNQIGDSGVAELAASEYLGNLAWLDLAKNDVTLAGVEALCASSKLPKLAYVSLVFNPVKDPGETYGSDWNSSDIMPETISLPQLGRELEAKYGYQAWLHGPSLLPSFPPLSDDF